MPRSKKIWELLIPGIPVMFASIISLITGMVLKDPIQKLVKPHCKVGGVWKPHSGMDQSCDINQVKNKFYINLQASFGSYDIWVIEGDGKVNGDEGEFTGKITYFHQTDILDRTSPIRKSENINGIISLQGCDGLGVTLLNTKTGTQKKTFAFIREEQKMEPLSDEKK
jgi:hypothetical protein